MRYTGPRTCVPRMRRRVPCVSLVCTGSAVDCVCANASCTTVDRSGHNATKWYCAQTQGTQLPLDGGELYGR